jgi:nucleotide-binding universal stress UspA family protein
MKKVLIALDYGPTAQEVAEEGYALAKTMEAEVVLMHVIADPTYYASTAFSPIMGFNGYMDIVPSQLDIIDKLKETSEEFLDKSKLHLGDDNIRTLVIDGDTADAILSTAKELSADIIVLGTHSRKWLEGVIMGSVTEEVLRHTSIPLFVIPTKGGDK